MNCNEQDPKFDTVFFQSTQANLFERKYSCILLQENKLGKYSEK